jgi:hypothetical protein
MYALSPSSRPEASCRNLAQGFLEAILHVAGFIWADKAIGEGKVIM